MFASVVTLALNVAEPLVAGEYGTAAFDAVGPLQLIGWSEVGPGFLQAIKAASTQATKHETSNDGRTTNDKSVPELARADRRRIAHLVAGSPVLGVDISGGEPLLLRDLPELIDVLIAGGCAVSVTTNGTHLARRAEALAARVDAMRVSMDGADAEHHDRWRGAAASPAPSSESARRSPTASRPKSRPCSYAPPRAPPPDRWSNWRHGWASTA